MVHRNSFLVVDGNELFRSIDDSRRSSMNNLCVIPARGGSRRVPRKNIRLFHGKPIIAYSIEAAKASGLFKYIVVSTDDEEIAAIAKQYGAWVIMREPRLAVDEVGTREVTIAAMDRVIHDTSQNIDFVCCLYATAPMVSVDDLTNGFHLIRLRNFAHVISVGYPPLQDAAQFYWSDGWVISHCDYFEESTGLIHVDQSRVCDINTEEDFLRAEAMYEALAHEKI